LLFLYCAPLGFFLLLLALLLLVPWVLFRMLRLQLPSPLGLLFFLGWFRSPARRTVPVRFLRLRDVAGGEMQVRIKGHLTGGTAERQDCLAVWGPVRHGVLHLRRPLNERTGSWIRIHGDFPYAWVILGTIAWIVLLWAGRQ